MHHFKNLLVPTDFGPAAWHALHMAIELCCGRKAAITLLHIYPSSAKFGSKSKHAKDNDNQEMDRIRNKMMSFSRELAKGKEITIHSMILRGWVEDTIFDFLNNNTFDLIVMGVNSNGLDNRPGSHITKMIEKTGIPLMVIPNSHLKEFAVS